MKKIFLLLLLCSSLKVEAQTSTFSRLDSLLERGRYQIVLKELMNSDPQTSETYYKIGAIYASIDNHKKAVVYYQKSIEQKSTYKATLMLGKSYQQLKEYSKAIEIYQKLIDEDANNLLLAYQLGKLYLIKDDFDAAEKVFENLIDLDSDNPEYYYHLGLIKGLKRDGNEMLNNFLLAYKKDTTHIKSIYQIAKTFQSLRVKDSSEIFTNKGLQLDDKHINLNKLKINELFRAENYKEAIQLLQKIDTIKPNELYTQKMLGRSYFNMENFDDAEKSFKKALVLDPEDFKIYTYIGHIEKARKNYRMALVNYLKATRTGKKPRYEEFYSLGILYIEMDDRKGAIEMFKKSIEESNRHYKTLYQLAFTSDSYYEDKKIAYGYYQDYINMFEYKDEDITAFVKRRMEEIKKELFLKGEKLDK